MAPDSFTKKTPSVLNYDEKLCYLTPCENELRPNLTQFLFSGWPAYEFEGFVEFDLQELVGRS